MGFNVGECIGHWQEAEVSGEDSMELQQRPLAIKALPTRSCVWTLSSQLVVLLWENVGTLGLGGPLVEVAYGSRRPRYVRAQPYSSASWSIWARQPCFRRLLGAVPATSLSPSCWPGSTPQTVSQNEAFFLQLSLVFGHNGEESTQYVFWKPRDSSNPGMTEVLTASVFAAKQAVDLAGCNPGFKL